MAIAHAERRMLGLRLPHYVLDVVREWKPPLANLSAIVGEIVALAKLYGIRQVVGDNASDSSGYSCSITSGRPWAGPCGTS
jgi:hypothetical protein